MLFLFCSYSKINSLNGIKNHKEEFYHSSVRLFKRSISLLLKKKKFNNTFEIASELYSKSIGRNHFGKSASQSFIANIYNIQPLMDPELKKIKFEISQRTSHDLISYLYIRLSRELIKFPFQGNRILNIKSIIKALKLNRDFKPYIVKTDYNKNFFIDNKRKSPVIGSSNKDEVLEYLTKLFKSTKYVNTIKKLYDDNVYNWANKFMNETDFFPLSQRYSLLAIGKALNSLSIF